MQDLDDLQLEVLEAPPSPRDITPSLGRARLAVD